MTRQPGSIADGAYPQANAQLLVDWSIQSEDRLVRVVAYPVEGGGQRHAVVRYDELDPGRLGAVVSIVVLR